MADFFNTKKESYAVRLGSLLTGKAVDVYTSLSPEISKDYDLLKKSLLQMVIEWIFALQRLSQVKHLNNL